ncbi:CHAT domain-containing protein [Streptomyces acidicola]|uniref:CHAT domain-containing protein n=1 Tax=Streptomyces acidicola TaxID=2596892 RepID=UPI0034323BE4
MSGTTTLDVRVSSHGGTVRYVYELRAHDSSGTGPLEREYTVDVNQSLVRDWRSLIDNALTAAAQGEDAPGPALVRWGRLLYDQLFPRVQGTVPELVTRLRKSTGPVLVRTNELDVPWELLHDGTDFLGLRYGLGRRSIVKQQVVGGRNINRVARALVVGDTIGDLAAAHEEVTKVAAWLRERGTECTVLLGREATVSAVVEELAADDPPYDLFHFCGHVVATGQAAGLMMHQRELLDEVALQTLSARGAPPVVFVNGCASAGRVANLCMSFMVMGAKTVVGTRAEVADDGAWYFASNFYGRLLAGESAGSAVRETRAALRGRPDAAWASFVLYGDPAASIAEGGAPAGATDLPDASDHASGPLAPEADKWIRRVYELAADRGLVTSSDLLLGLLSADGLREGLESSIGAERLDVLGEVLRAVIEQGSDRDNDGADGDGSVVLSDTVARVLNEANARASGRGSSAATTADIAAAFVDVGGGMSVRLLELCGIPLELLLPDRPGTPDDPAETLRTGLFGADLPDRGAAAALRLAHLLASSQGKLVGTYTLLLALGMMDSAPLRRCLMEQGPAGERAHQELSGLLTPRREDFSPRALAALDQAHRGATGQVDEAELLRALLADEQSSASRLLRKFGVDPALLTQALDPGG